MDSNRKRMALLLGGALACALLAAGCHEWVAARTADVNKDVSMSDTRANETQPSETQAADPHVCVRLDDAEWRRRLTARA